MTHCYTKIVKLILLVFVSTLFLSGTELDAGLTSLDSQSEDYTIKISGNSDFNFEGVFYFETSMVTNSKGVSFSILKLKLNRKKSGLNDSIEFLISREQTKELMPIDVYRKIENKKSLLDNFDGVFGVANINELGEAPFFAKSGEIQISYLDDTTLKGKLFVSMHNTLGNSIKIRGNFFAKNYIIM